MLNALALIKAAAIKRSRLEAAQLLLAKKEV